jgi:2-iminobutanoate/2-iminopropanoate deaminase
VSEVKGIATSSAPAALGAYSQAVEAGPWVWVSGQLGIDPATGSLVEGGPKAEAAQAMANVLAILKEAGLGPRHLLRVAIYLTRMEAFPEVNEAYARALGDARPARVTVGVAALPRGASVEIEAVATR